MPSSRPPGSTLIASYGVPDELIEPASREFAAIARAWTERAGEQQISWPAPDETESIARDASWTRVRRKRGLVGGCS